MIWKYLSKAQLQNFIGDQLLGRLEQILPALQRHDYDALTLYKKENLTKIFNAFITIDFFRNRNHLKELLDSIPENELHNLCLATDINTNDQSFNELLELSLRRGWRNRDYCAKFLKWAQLPTSFLPPEKFDITSEEVLHPVDSPYKILKDFQFTVYLRAKYELTKNLNRFVIQMPTGSGKTRTAMEFITDFINNSSGESVIVWLAHSEELCEQSLVCFKEVWAHVAKRDLRLFRCWGANASLPYAFSGSAFIVAGFQKLYSILTKNEIPFVEIRNRIKLIIVDEAHKVIAPTYKKVTKALMGQATRVVGLTATPGRGTDNIGGNKELSDFFFQNIISVETPPDKSVISYLRDKKIIAKLISEPLITGITYTLTPQQQKFLENNFDFPPGFLNTIGSDDVRNLEIVKRFAKELDKGSVALFFACSIEHSKFICSLLIYLGYAAAHIDGSTDKALRRQYLEDFKAKKLQVLCNYGVLSTGFDAPQTDLIFISRPTTSIVLYSQMIGRGLRGPAIGGTEKCKLIDVKDNIIGFSDYDNIYDYFEEYWSENDYY